MLLKKIYNPPVVLYCKGQPLQYKEDVVAIVGTRRFTPYGKSVTLKLTSDLISNNITFVSGLARGIDTIAHKTTVEGGGRTISVFGAGLDVLYPAENKKQQKKLVKKGLLSVSLNRGQNRIVEIFHNETELFLD